MQRSFGFVCYSVLASTLFSVQAFSQNRNQSSWVSTDTLAWSAYASGDCAKAFILAKQQPLTANLQTNRLLGFLYFNGCGVAKDDKTALLFFRKALAEHDDAAALYIGRYYDPVNKEYSLNGVPKDYATAKKYYLLTINGRNISPTNMSYVKADLAYLELFFSTSIQDFKRSRNIIQEIANAGSSEEVKWLKDNAAWLNERENSLSFAEKTKRSNYFLCKLNSYSFTGVTGASASNSNVNGPIKYVVTDPDSNLLAEWLPREQIYRSLGSTSTTTDAVIAKTSGVASNGDPIWTRVEINRFNLTYYSEEGRTYNHAVRPYKGNEEVKRWSGNCSKISTLPIERPAF